MVNADKPGRWNADTRASVLQYNNWFMDFAPKTYQGARSSCSSSVDKLFEQSDFLRNYSPRLLVKEPETLSVLRMMCAPPIARDRLAGLANVSRGNIKSMEEGKLPKKNQAHFIANDIPAILAVINRLIDKQLMPWLDISSNPSQEDLLVAQSVIADRLCGSTADPIIRNAQEARQLAVISAFLDAKGYHRFDDATVSAFDMPRGTYAFHKNVQMYRNAQNDIDGYVNTPVDVVIMPTDTSIDKPFLVECKSAGDFANTNKRRKEEDAKVTQLRATYGDDVVLYLFLCGYFEAQYLGYEAANHMDWVWEHRVEDFNLLGI
jgi:hypothetical protein